MSAMSGSACVSFTGPPGPTRTPSFHFSTLSVPCPVSDLRPLPPPKPTSYAREDARCSSVTRPARVALKRNRRLPALNASTDTPKRNARRGTLHEAQCAALSAWIERRFHIGTVILTDKFAELRRDWCPRCDTPPGAARGCHDRRGSSGRNRRQHRTQQRVRNRVRIRHRVGTRRVAQHRDGKSATRIPRQERAIPRRCTAVLHALDAAILIDRQAERVGDGVATGDDPARAWNRQRFPPCSRLSALRSTSTDRPRSSQSALPALFKWHVEPIIAPVHTLATSLTTRVNRRATTLR